MASTAHEAWGAAPIAPPGPASGRRRVLVLSPYPARLPIGGGERYALSRVDGLNRFTSYHATYMPAESFDGRFDAYDLVHVPTPDRPLSRLARRAGMPVAITFHAGPRSMARHGFETGRRGLFRIGQAAAYGLDMWRTNRAIAHADVVLCVSECTLADVVWQAPRRHRAKARLQEQGIDTDWWTPGAGRDGGFLLFVGRLVRSKGVDLFVDVATRLGLPAKVVGSGPLEAELRRRAGPRVEFLGSVSDERLRALYQEASLAVFPSLAEGYGLVGLESLACGCPTAVSDAFCIRGPAQARLAWFPRGDAPALEATIRRLWGTKTPAWSREAARVVAEHHSLRRSVEELAHVYDGLLEGRR